MPNLLYPATLAAGFAALGWIGAGYLGSHPFALALTAGITAAYAAGVVELHRFGRDTRALAGALATVPAELPSLADWLAGLPAPLQQPVRARVETERTSLPGPAMAPYLTGLLVLLGMLGTFLGMVATLNGTGAALDSATSVEAVRNTLAAPVRGLGLAFGTSVAGIAASTALGLLVALRRRERQRVSQALDRALAHSGLRAHSRLQQREDMLRLMQRQVDVLQQQAQHMPALVDGLRGLMERLDERARTLDAQLAHGQQATAQHLHDQHRRLADALQAQHRALADGLQAQNGTLAERLHQQHGTLAERLQQQHGALADTLGARQAELGERLTGQHEALAARIAGQQAAWQADTTAAYAGLAASVARTLDDSVRTSVQESARLATQSLQPVVEGTLAQLGRETAGLHAALSQAAEQHLGAIASELRGQLGGITQSLREQLAAAGDRLSQQQQALLQAVQAAQERALALQATQDAERLAGWQQALRDWAGELQQQARAGSAEALAQQRQICQTLEQTAQALSARSEAQARDTLGRLGELVEQAAQAPRMAAEVIAEMRQRFSDSVARDQAALEERTRLMDTLATLLDAVNRASHEQRGAIDALIAATAGVLEQAGARFAEQASAEAGKIAAAAAQATGSVVELASVGEAFGTAVLQFGQTGQQLAEQLGRVEAALGQHMERSDEQLGYYVAQARELIDLSVASQKHIIDQLQQLAGRTPALDAS
ncbi:hypothetical protein [Ideonella sp.]|uniref:hypothetical protein n=1 Tax=Ideonella sp. TaxID=1929293 RepID=UPI0035B31E65